MSQRALLRDVRTGTAHLLLDPLPLARGSFPGCSTGCITLQRAIECGQLKSKEEDGLDRRHIQHLKRHAGTGTA
jgi:hypothetical protein